MPPWLTPSQPAAHTFQGRGCELRFEETGGDTIAMGDIDGETAAVSPSPLTISTVTADEFVL
jgi:hypothetical protein